MDRYGIILGKEPPKKTRTVARVRKAKTKYPCGDKCKGVWTSKCNKCNLIFRPWCDSTPFVDRKK